MARLRHLRFVSIGHPNARCDDLTIPLVDANGGPIDTTIWLRNAGGKSQTLTLFYSLVRPRKRDFLGHTAEGGERRLGDYVLKDDAALIIAEWELDSPQPSLLPTADRLITGVFYERGEIGTSGQAGDDGEKRVEVDKLFFALRATDRDSETTLGGLPVYEDVAHRHRRRLKQFRRALETVRERNPASQVVFTREIGEWEELLRSYGLDPELFQYQLRMNAAEGGATRIFQDCRTVRDFVNLFLEILVDREFGERIRTHLEQHRDQLRRRSLDLEPGLRLVELALPIAVRYAELHSGRERVRSAGDATRGSALALAHYAGMRLCEVAHQISSQQAQVDQAESSARAQREAATALFLQSATLKRDLAVLAVRSETATVETLAIQLREATRNRDLWDAAVVLRDHERHAAEAARYREALARREEEAMPLLQAVQVAADDYAAALGARISGFSELEVRAKAARDREQESEDRARTEHGVWTQHWTQAKDRARAIRQSLEQMTADQARLVSAGVMQLDESPAAAVRRLAEELQTEQTRREQNRQSIQERAVAVDLARKEAERAKEARISTDYALGEVARRLAVATAEGAALAREARLLSVLELESIDGRQLDEHAATLVRAAAASELERLLLARTELSQAERSLNALESTGLLPDSPDVIRVLAHLVAAGVTAHSCWHYLAETFQSDAARAFTQTFPAVGSSIVIPDAHFAAAESCLRSVLFDLDGPVVVLRQSTVVRAHPTLENQGAQLDLVVLPSRDLHFDRAAGRASIPAARVRAHEIQGRADTADRERVAFDHLYARVMTFLERYGPAWFPAEEAEHERLRGAVSAAAARAESLHAALAAAEQSHADAQRAVVESEKRADSLGASRERLADFVRRWGTDASQLEKQKTDADNAIIHAAGERDRLEKERTAHALRRQQADEQLRSLNGQLSVARQEWSQIQYRRGDVAPKGGDVAAARAVYHERLAAYEGKVARDSALHFARHAEEQAKDYWIRFQRKCKHVTMDEVRGTLAGVSDPSTAEDELDRAQSDYLSAFGSHGNRSQLLQRLRSDAERVITELATTGLVPVEVTARMSELPIDDGSLSERWAEQQKMAQQSADAATVEADEYEKLASLAKESLSKLLAARSAVGNGQRMLEAIAQPAAALLENFAPPSDLIHATPSDDEQFAAGIVRLQGEVTTLRENWEALNDTQRALTNKLRTLLGSSEFAHLDDPMFRRLRSAEGVDLESHAEEIERELGLRRTILIEAIADLDKHLNDLVQLTLAAAEEGRRLLRLATARSQLADHVPAPLGGRPFLRILHVDASKDAEADRAAAKQLVEAWVKTEKAIPPALSLVHEAVLALSPKAQVQILFPDAAKQQVRMDPITALASYSGGEKLTAATLIFCTLARVRAQKRGALGYGTNVLLCDNPQGTSSLPTLLTWQREVASALGVQLVYFTGIEDLEAIRIMPNTVRIENSRYDGRTNQQVLEIAEQDNPALAALRLVRSEAQYPVLARRPDGDRTDAAEVRL
jgi:hypothetical protein